MSIRISESEAAAFFRERDRFLIFTHNSADADTVGSARALVLALRKLGKQADAFNREGVPARLSFLRPEEVFLPELPPLEGRTLVSVDVASPRLLSEPESAFVFALSIDHHMVNSMQCERLCLRDDFPAAGELVFLLLKELGVRARAGHCGSAVRRHQLGQRGLPLRVHPPGHDAVCGFADGSGHRFRPDQPPAV